MEGGAYIYRYSVNKRNSNLKLCNCSAAPSSEILIFNSNYNGFWIIFHLDAIPGLLEFKNYCTEHASDEYFLQELYSHPFFKQDFINIYSFLEELPVKSEEEKSYFLK